MCGDTPAMSGPRKGEADTEGSTDRGVGSRFYGWRCIPCCALSPLVRDHLNVHG